MSEVVGQVHLCDGCGKASFAAKRPARHQRFVRDEGQGAPEAFIIHHPPEYGFEDEIHPGGWMVSCGPFTTYDIVTRNES